MKTLSILFASSAQAHMGDDFYGHHMMDGDGGFSAMMGGYGGLGSGILALLFWILVIAGIIYLIRYLGQDARDRQQSKTPLDILKERYARGEIDKEEFERRKRDLR
jgi:putative membrane protein